MNLDNIVLSSMFKINNKLKDSIVKFFARIFS